jgi:hypothetical protein
MVKAGPTLLIWVLGPVDRYQAQCRPAWDLIMNNLQERQPAVDCVTLVKLAGTDASGVRSCGQMQPSGRLLEIPANLYDRIAEAERDDWLGEADDLKVSLADSADKLA